MLAHASLRVRAHSSLRSAFSSALLAALLFTAACSGGGGGTPEPPDSSLVQAVGFGTDSVRLAAGAGSADSGAAVSAISGATGTGTAAADGSFSFDAALSAGAAEITVQYVKEGYTLTSISAVSSQASLVTKPLFSTGAGPNDMVYGHDSLYIANSMDNTVVRYSLTGATLASASFPAGASPSYLALGGNALWVVCNGDNHVVGLNAEDLTDLASSEFLLTGEGVAFIGPSQPIVSGSVVYVPRNEIATFSPTTYGPGKVAGLNFASGQIFELATTGLDPQFGVYDNSRDSLYITCSGNIQFDEFFVPHAESDSYLERVQHGTDSSDPQQLNLGRIGAGRVALSPDGSTALIGTSLAANLYAVDMDSFTTLRGAANPITLTGDFSFASDVAFTPDGRYALAASFNTDELYVLDARTFALNPGPYPAPFDLALSADMLAGAANIEIAPDPERSGKYAAYVLYGVGNAVAKVELF
jgi:hypothetical protein